MLAVLALTLLAGSGIVRGTVSDPSARPVPNARVEVTCLDIQVRTETDASGTFALDLPAGPGACTVWVSHAGFRDVSLRLEPGQDRARLTITLPIEPWDEHVDVRAPPQGLAEAATGAVSASTLGADALNVAGPDAWRWLLLAERGAGHPPGARALSINGLPADTSPPSDVITAIGLGSDPFGVEATGADRVRLDVTTEPGRRWQFALSPGVATNRQHDMLMPSASRESQSRAASAGGPLTPTGRVRAYATGSTTRATSEPTYIEAADGGDRLATGLSSTTTASGWTAGVAARLGPLSTNAAVFANRMDVTNGGVGGRTGPSGAINLTTDALRLQTTWRYASPRIATRGGFSAQRHRRDTSAASWGPGVIFADRLLRGSPDALALSHTANSWQAREVVESAGSSPRPWLAGVEVTSDSLREDRTYNPDGLVILTAATDRDGARIRRDDIETQQAATRRFAAFGQRVVANSNRAWARLGARAEWQPGLGATFDPRLAGAVRLGRFLAGANAGAFSDLWPAWAELERGFRTAGPVPVISDGNRSWPLVFEGRGSRRSDYVLRASLIRPVGAARVSFEQTVSLGRRLTGLTRRADGGRLIDQLDNNRNMRRTQSHVRADFTVGRWQSTLHYEYAHATDNTDGTFALPARQGLLGQEVGPSIGIPRHAFTALLSGRLPGGIRALVTAHGASGTPYSLLTGLDPDGLFTFTGRLSASRNQQRLPAATDVAAYLARTFRLPLAGLTLDTGLRLENLLASITPLEIERSASSTLAGRTISAAGGRSVSIWTTFGRR